MSAIAPVWHPAGDPDRGVRRSTALFVDEFGHDPAGVWAAPGRVNLIGEHVDYNAGRCLPLALGECTYVAAGRRDGGVVRVHSERERSTWSGRLDELDPAAMPTWARYAVGPIWSLRAAGIDPDGLDLAVTGDVPIGAGLSSSASLICAVAVAAAELAGWDELDGDVARSRLADLAVDAETVFVGAPTGGMDQAISMRAAERHGLLLDCRNHSIEQLPLDLEGHGLTLLVIDTRVSHSNLDGGYGNRRLVCERAAHHLGVAALGDVADRLHDHEKVDDAVAGLGPEERAFARHVVSEILRVDDVARRLRSGALEAIGSDLDASHVSLRDDFAVSCAELDLAVDTARSEGALGARMTGGGFGGSAVALVPSDAAEVVAARVADAFAASSFKPPSFLMAQPSGPARRIA